MDTEFVVFFTFDSNVQKGNEWGRSTYAALPEIFY